VVVASRRGESRPAAAGWRLVAALALLLAGLDALAAAIPAAQPSWTTEQGVLRCGLWQATPSGGRMGFTRLAGEPLRLRVEGLVAASVQPLELWQVRPGWRQFEPEQRLGALADQKGAWQLSGAPAEAAYAALGEGMALAVRPADGEAATMVLVTLSPVQFLDMAPYFRECERALPQVGAAQLDDSRIPFARGRTGLGPRGEAAVARLAAFVKLDAEVERIRVWAEPDRMEAEEAGWEALAQAEARAEQVRLALEVAGVAPERIEVGIGRGAGQQARVRLCRPAPDPLGRR